MLGGDADAGVADREADPSRRPPSPAPCARSPTIQPASVNLTALLSRLSSTWRSRAASPMSHSGTPGSTLYSSRSSLRSRDRAHDRHACREPARSARTAAAPARAWPASTLEKSRMSLTMASSADVGGPHQFDVAALLAGQPAGRRQQVDEAGDAGQRRADLVAHDRQEFGLGDVGGSRLRPAPAAPPRSRPAVRAPAGCAW